LRAEFVMVDLAVSNTFDGSAARQAVDEVPLPGCTPLSHPHAHTVSCFFYRRLDCDSIKKRERESQGIRAPNGVVDRRRRRNSLHRFKFCELLLRLLIYRVDLFEIKTASTVCCCVLFERTVSTAVDNGECFYDGPPSARSPSSASSTTVEYR
jgi:hypothetical protein